jgi:glycosidase
VAILLALTCASACAPSAPLAKPIAPKPDQLVLDVADADVWSEQVRVSGASRGAGVLARCELVAGSARYPARTDGRTFAGQVALSPGANDVYASCSARDGRALRSSSVRFTVRLTALPEPPASVAGDIAPPVAWHASAVVYGVVPPLFGTPPLRSVSRALDRLAALGVSVLWLSPVFATPPGNFGYAVTDYFAVRADYGSAADLEQLVSDAHARGLRVVLDLPPNHTSREHPYFVQAAALGRMSHYFEFYDRDRFGRATHYFDWVDLPNLAYPSVEVERWISEASAYWLRGFDVDGYRVDAAWGVAQRDPRFFPAWSRMLRAIEPGALLIAEASARDAYYAGAGFDAAYDWDEELGHWAWQGVFDAPAGIATRLRAALERTAERTSPERVFRFLNNNDTGARFITRHGEALAKVATAALLTLPGIPCLYAFDEVGAEYEPYDQEGPVRAPERPELLRFHQQLVALRRQTPALHAAGIQFLAREQPDALVFARYDDRAGAAAEHALVALNFAAQPVALRAAVPRSLRGLVTRYRDALSGAEVDAGAGEVALTLPGFGIAILVPIVDNAAGATRRPLVNEAAGATRRPP